MLALLLLFLLLDVSPAWLPAKDSAPEFKEERDLSGTERNGIQDVVLPVLDDLLCHYKDMAEQHTGDWKDYKRVLHIRQRIVEMLPKQIKVARHSDTGVLGRYVFFLFRPSIIFISETRLPTKWDRYEPSFWTFFAILVHEAIHGLGATSHVDVDPVVDQLLVVAAYQCDLCVHRAMGDALDASWERFMYSRLICRHKGRG